MRGGQEMMEKTCAGGRGRRHAWVASDCKLLRCAMYMRSCSRITKCGQKPCATARTPSVTNSVATPLPLHSCPPRRHRRQLLTRPHASAAATAAAAAALAATPAYLVERAQALGGGDLVEGLEPALVQQALAVKPARLVVQPRPHDVQRVARRAGRKGGEQAAGHVQLDALGQQVAVDEGLLHHGVGRQVGGRVHGGAQRADVGALPQPRDALLPRDPQQRVRHPRVAEARLLGRGLRLQPAATPREQGGLSSPRGREATPRRAALRTWT
eukprot:scaffold156_cov308-Prasinococcus_capsulatus_cf.AAC.19